MARQLFLPAFRAQLASYGLRRTLQRTGDQTLGALEALLSPALPNLSLGPSESGPNSRQRVFIRVNVRRKGFRPGVITLMTTLLETKKFPSQMIQELYLRRWRLELCLRDLKTTMGMEELRGKSPEMAEKELYAYLVAHNLLRWIMADVVRQHDVPMERMSFKGTVDAVRHFSQAMAGARSGRCRRRLYARLLGVLAADLVPERPGRREPRAVKRRPKPFAQLNKHRRIYVEQEHRSRYRKNRS